VKAKRQSVLHPNQLKATLGLTKYALLATLRNKTALFFSLVFPLVFVAVFGFLGSETTQIRFGVTEAVNRQNPVYVALKELAASPDAPIVIEEGSSADLEKMLAESDLDAVIEPVANDQAGLYGGVTLISSNANPTGYGAAQSILTGLVNEINLRAAGITRPAYTIADREVSGKAFRYIDFALPGQIGFSLLSLATYGVAFSFITLRRTLVLKRLFATTITPLTFVLSQCISRAVQAVIQTAIILAVGIYAFDFAVPNGWVSFLQVMLIAVFGAFVFLGFGMLVAGIAKDEQSAPVALNLFNLPQMLLTGVFFPTDGMPQWVQAIGNNLPLAYFNTAVRKIVTEGQGFGAIWPYLLGMLAWAIVAYFLAARTFKSE
jgi:ABC-2 type transport system permease protein